MIKATLSLFNAIQVDSKTKSKNLRLKETIKHGFVLTPQAANVVDNEDIAIIADVVGISGEKANASFHKSWKIIEESSQEELVMQAVIHYMTTYGFESMGMYRDDAIYIPAEELKLPKIKDGIRLVIIKGLTKDEILEKIVDLSSGVALKDDTLKSLMEIIEFNKYDKSLVKKVKNRELKSKLYDYYDIVPDEPVEFLRFAINRITDDSLLIKSDRVIKKIIKDATPLHVKTLDRMLDKAPANLAEIFLRYKPLFLALKKVSKNKTFFNKLRKKADKMHKPIGESFLNTITGTIKKGQKINRSRLESELDKSNIFRKIRLASALKYRVGNPSSIVYRIRNGRGYATEFKFENNKEAFDILETVVDSIAKDMKHLKGKTIYIPDVIKYALPATEKMFTGNFPTGTYVTVPTDMVVGIHWYDTDGHRVDMDLSTISATGKIGWDARYRGEGDSVLFSGDMTAAPKPFGASELFYFKEAQTDPKIMYVNYFNYTEKVEVDVKILVASDKPSKFRGVNYMVDVSKIIASASIKINQKSSVLALIARIDNENRFYFCNVSIGNNITSSSSIHTEYARQYFYDSMTQALDFETILKTSGARVVHERPTKKGYIDLSPEALDKTTILNLITNK